ncbi:MAG: helix-turn-helix domain-containing protein [Candidatus Omnitrophota bacterium]|nr:helix-turn-helix domain-containing protein [Candidatus Omnitrophota bacterium]
MTLQQVADYLGLHHLTIYKLVQERKIPAAKVGGSWRFKKDVLDQWIEQDMAQRGSRSGRNGRNGN